MGSKDAVSRKAKVLVVDDEESVCQMLSSTLEAAGYQVRYALDFAAVRRMFADEEFDLVTCDIVMPEVNGLEVLAWIRQHRPEVGVVMASALSGSETVIEAIRAGALDYLVKPFNVALVVQQLEKALAHQRLVRENEEYRQGLEDLVRQRTQDLKGKVAELERREEEVRVLSRAVEQSPASVMITDVKGRIEYVNPKFTRLTGYSLEEVRGKNPSLLKSGRQDRGVYHGLWDTVLGGGEWRGELHNRKKNGELYWESASISAIRGKDGGITHLLAVKEDITARKEAEEALGETQMQLKRRVRELEGRDRLVQLQFEGVPTDRSYERVVEVIAQVFVARRVEAYAVGEGACALVAALGDGGDGRALAEAAVAQDKAVVADREMAAPVSYGEEPLAAVWVGAEGGECDSAGVETLERLAREVALVLHMARTVDDVEAGVIEVGDLLALGPEGEEHGTA